MKTIGIVAHSIEGASLCYVTACRYGAERLGTFMHPTIVLSSVPMALSMPGWNSGRLSEVGTHLARGIDQVAMAGAEFYICPDNTAHIVLEQIAHNTSIPGLHIADVVCFTIKGNSWRRAGLLGTDWTMTGPVYPKAAERHGIALVVPNESTRNRIHAIIFDELCQGVFLEESRKFFAQAIQDLKREGADCVVLGCTEIPLIVDETVSCLPTVDSTRLLAKSAVNVAIQDGPIETESGWIRLAW